MKHLFKIIISLLIVIFIVIFLFNYLSGLDFAVVAPTATSTPSPSPSPSPIPTPTLTPTPTPTPSPTPTPIIVEIKISAIGDCFLGDNEDWIATDKAFSTKEQFGLNYYFKKVVSILSKDDISIANCEGTFTESDIRITKINNPSYWYKGPPSYAQIFKLGSVEYVNLANNHFYDFGQIGYTDTKNNLKKYGVQYFGNGNISYFKKDNITIALLGYNLVGKDYKIEAEKIIKDIKLVSTKSDIQIISLHWGIMGATIANQNQIWLGHYLVDNGADLILGTHPHVIQPIEVYKEKTIVYSLGNFLYGGALYSNPKTFIFQQTFKFIDGQLAENPWKAIPCLSYSGSVNNFQPVTDTN